MILAGCKEEQRSVQSHIKTKTSIKSLPPEIVIMIIEMLSLEDALELCKTLKLREQVAVQYFYFSENYDVIYILDSIDLRPSSYKFMLKNKRFQIRASSCGKTLAALKTFDLDFVKNCIKEFKPDLDNALLDAIWIGFTEAVNLLLSDPRVGRSLRDNEALRFAVVHMRVEVVKLLLSDPRVDPSARDNEAFNIAIEKGNVEIVKILLSHPRIDLSAERIIGAIYDAENSEIVKLLQLYLEI